MKSARHKYLCACPAWALPCALMVALVPAASATVITGTQNFQVVARLTGPIGSNSINPTWQVGVQGTDLGHMVNHNGKTYLLFGDTFDSGGNQGSGGPDFRNNVMAWTTDTNPADGITFDGWVTRPNGTAKQVIFPSNEPTIPGFQPITYIPTGAISVGDKIYAWSMRVDWDGYPGVGGDDWMVGYAGLSRWREGDSQFTNVSNFRFEAPDGGPYTWGGVGPGNFGMVAASYRSPLENANDPHVYLWGTPGGRDGGVKLARVLPGQIENLSAYQFYNGTVNGEPQWVNNEFDAQKIIPSRPEGGTGVGEMSVVYNEAMRAWTMTSISGGPVQFHIRYAENPWGPWSDPVNIPVTTQPDRWGPYAPYMNPLYVENDGRTIYFTMSYWEPYDVFLAKVDLNLDFRTRWKGIIGSWINDPNWSHGLPTAEHHTTLDNGGRIRISSAASVRALDVGTQDGMGGTIEMFGAAALTVHSGGFRLGLAQGGSGTLEMSNGSVQVLDPTRMFIVGDAGNGTATISGGSITTRTFSIGQQATATGHVNLSGNAVITTTGDRFQMGRFRDSTTGAQSVASLTMTGGTINVNTGGGIADFVPAFEGTATMNMSGGTINVGNNFVAAVAGSSGQAPRSQATITQSGGTINTGGMTLGERGVSQYTLSGTGQINARGLMRLGWFGGGQSTFTQNGGGVSVAQSNPALDFVGLKIGEGGEGTYTIQNGTLSVPGRLWIAELPGSVGRMNIHGGAVAVGDNLAVGMQGNGGLTQTGGQLSVGGALHIAAGNPNSVGTHHHAGGTLNVTGTLNVGRDNGNGTSHISGGNVSAGSLLRVWSTGSLTLSGGKLYAATLRHNEGGTFNFSGGTLHVDTFTGNLTNAAGTLAPGNLTGTTNISGNYTQLADAVLAADIGGTSPRGEFDRVIVGGSAALGGQLQVSLTGGFIPNSSHTFSILAAANLSGTFNNIAAGQRLQTTDGAGSFLVLYGSSANPNELILTGFLPGDFNSDGVVDALDYVVARRSIEDGTRDPSHYGLWSSHFGATAANPTSAPTGATGAAVPEPNALVLLLLSITALALGGGFHGKRT